MKSKISCKQNFYNINTRLALSLSLSIVFCVLPLKNTCTCSFDESGKISPNSVSLSHTHTPFIEMGARSLIDYLCHSISILQSPYLVFSLSHTYQLLSLSLSCISFMCPCSHYLKYWYKHALSYSYTHGTTHTQPLSFKWSDIRYLNGIFLASFSLHLTEQMWSIKVAVDCIRSRVLWYGR